LYVVQRSVMQKRQLCRRADASAESFLGPALEELRALGVAECEADATATCCLTLEGLNEVKLLLSFN
jgi:hypothetical protein